MERAKREQIAQHVPPKEDPGSLVLFRVEPKAISMLDYRKGFGHTELIIPADPNPGA